MRKFVLLSKVFICSFQFVFAQSSSKEITDKVGQFDLDGLVYKKQ
ncbi:MAG: hypothetical protein ACM3H8_10390 [Sphingobacteriales bacterium]